VISKRSYRLSDHSKRKLVGVNKDLIHVVIDAIKTTKQDFRVLEGCRTKERQKELVRLGASQTLNSKHISGDAVDLGAWLDGSVSWHWPLYIEIAEAMRKSAINNNVVLTWGACWHNPINNYDSAQEAMEDYIKYKNDKNQKPFLDGAHFQIEVVKKGKQK